MLRFFRLVLPVQHDHRMRSLASLTAQKLDSTSGKVGIFWDLDNKPPNAIPPYEAASRLKLAASSFGTVNVAVAYANPHTFCHVPAPVRADRAHRQALDHLEDVGIHTPSEPYVCRVCGRNFYHHTKLVNHFKQIHERENMKRLHRLESAKGSQKVRLAAKFSMKMDKYRRAAREVLVPKVGYGLAEELRRAGICVWKVEDKPEAADKALRAHMVDSMDRGLIGCLMLVSDDAEFTGVLREARMRCLRTVVVGDDGDGLLKRCADASFSWKDVASGKAKKEAVSAVRRWKDWELLKRLEWTYMPAEKEELCGGDLDEESDDGDDQNEDLVGSKSLGGAWWKCNG